MVSKIHWIFWNYWISGRRHFEIWSKRNTAGTHTQEWRCDKDEWRLNFDLQFVVKLMKMRSISFTLFPFLIILAGFTSARNLSHEPLHTTWSHWKIPTTTLMIYLRTLLDNNWLEERINTNRWWNNGTLINSNSYIKKFEIATSNYNHWSS